MTALDEPMVSFRAGRMQRISDGQRHIIKALSDSGELSLAVNRDDDLIHLYYKNRESGAVEDDLIVFPGDAKFVKVEECTTGRVYCLKFSSSSQRLFYWLQSSPADRDQLGLASEEDEQLIGRANRIMEEESMDQDPVNMTEEPVSKKDIPDTAPIPEESSSVPKHLQTLIQNINVEQFKRTGLDPSLSDLLRVETLLPILAHLPAELALPEGISVEDAVISTQLRQSLDILTHALRNGGLKSVCEALGLECTDENAGVRGLVDAVRRKVKSEDEHS